MTLAAKINMEPLVSVSRTETGARTPTRLDLALREFMPSGWQFLMSASANPTESRRLPYAPGVTELRDSQIALAVADIERYTWFSQENFDTAMTWCAGLVASSQLDQRVFLLQALVDLYHYDRAQRCTTIHELQEPTQDIPTVLFNGSSRYDRVNKVLTWDNKTPRAATTALSQVLSTTPPDLFWLADYVLKQQPAITFDPVLYAQYGTWHVEVARWD